MNPRKISKFLQAIAFLFFLNTTNAQQKIIGFLNRGALDGNGTAYTINTNGTGYQKNVEFPFAPGQGLDMVDGNDGYFYGSTTGNGFGDAGSIFKIKPDGTGYTLLKKFTRTTDGGSIRWRPFVAPDGYLYGICEDGGQYSNGTIWKLKNDGSTFTVLKTFNNSVESTSGFFGSLLMGLDGKLYGTIAGGDGSIIRINTNGSGFIKLVTFTNNAGSYLGSGPRAPMLLASDGNFYGVCVGGGTGKGVAFKYNPATNVYTLLKSFTDNDGANPANTPVEASNDYIIGGCPGYGTLNGGSIWRVKKDGSGFSVLQQLDLAVTGNRPGRKLYIHTNGLVYGTLEGYGPMNTGSFFSITQDGSAFTVLRSSFEGGEQPWALIYRESDNKFYIPFNYGGSGSGGYFASVNPDGSGYRHLYSFAYQAEGYGPINTPSVVTDLSSAEYGKAFGVTTSGGLNANGNLFSYYTGFPSQRHTILHNFIAADGYSPAGRNSVFLASDGLLYGILGYGGPIAGNSGTAYRINPQDTTTFTIIKSFGNFGTLPTNTTNPGDMMEAADGYLYGSTSQAGDNNKGAIFKMQKDGSSFSNIYQFGGSNTLTGGAGFIYDTATQKLIGVGSISSNDGVIFSINRDGTGLSVIKTFAYANGATDGFGLSAPLKFNNDTLYGTAGGGASGFGVIYKIHKNGTGFSVIKSFVNTEGGSPYGNLQLGEDDYLYGACGGTIYLSSGPNIYKIKKDGSNFTILKSFGTDLNSVEGNTPGQIVLLPCSTPQNGAEITFSNSSTSSITISGFTPPASGGVTGYVVKMNTVNSFTP
ncbi:MAG: choice-of-anchor tandem repeat GloVer-containing protein, partial [Ginsengibacter sp.]